MPRADAPGAEQAGGLTTAEVARRYRVGEDRVRGWIKSGALRAINTTDAASGKPRFVILPDALAEFERVRSTVPSPKPVRRKRTQGKDWFPDD